MKFEGIFSNMTRMMHRSELKLKKYSPEILVVTGVVGVVASAVMACKATTKVNEILTETKAEVDKVHEVMNNDELRVKEETKITIDENGNQTTTVEKVEVYSEEDSKKDLAIIYTRSAMKFVKLYGPSVLLGAASIGCIFASHNILNKRNAALAAAYSIVDKGFKEYRSRVIDRFGNDVDKELKYNIKAEEIEEKVVDENGEEKVEKKIVSVANTTEYSDYAKFYDCGCTGWTKDPELNLMFLKRQQRYANDKLKADGYLFLNDVYEMLGINKTKAGQIVGWVYNEKNPNGDNYIDFGIYDIHSPSTRDFVNGYERTILLDFNVDGNILDLI